MGKSGGEGSEGAVPVGKSGGSSAMPVGIDENIPLLSATFDIQNS
jgi:hypothetical protein